MTNRFYSIRDFANITADTLNQYRSKKQSQALKLTPVMDSADSQVGYDVFLSHSSKDKDLAKKIVYFLETQRGFSVYVDWEEDKGISRNAAAKAVRKAMDKSKCFIVLRTKNSENSSWVPWEMGYFDKKTNHTAPNNNDQIFINDKMGVLFVKEDDMEAENFKNEEFWKEYIFLDKDTLASFIASGANYAKKFIKTDTAIKSGNEGNPTKFYGVN